MSSGVINPLDDPAKAAGDINALLKEVSQGDTPVIEAPPSDVVDLPGGLVKGGKAHRTAQVRELTGEHEEALAKAQKHALQSGNWAHFLSVLLECGVIRIGDESPGRTTELLADLLLGDRDALILGIREATYGDTVDITGWQCPKCREASDLSLNLHEDIESVKLGDPRQDSVFTVKLRRGRIATVRLANGHDQEAVFERDGLNSAERDTVLLSRCLTLLTDPDGTEHAVAGFATSIARSLSIPDRRAILREMIKRQPGPRYNEIEFKHQACGEEVPLSLGLGDLFPDI